MGIADTLSCLLLFVVFYDLKDLEVIECTVLVIVVILYVKKYKQREIVTKGTHYPDHITI